MTRSFRAIRIRPTHLTLLTGLVFGALTLTADAAFAESTASQQTTATVGDAVSNDASAALRGSDDVASLTAPQASAPDVPTVETPLHHFYCVEYARLRSGLEIFGDAKTWWQRAGSIYAKFTQPATDAVMVFCRQRADCTRGHVAVVARIVSPREMTLFCRVLHRRTRLRLRGL
jgi:hypothetical protein